MENNNPLADKRIIIFGIVSFLFFMGWEKFISHKYPQAKKAVVVQEPAQNNSQGSQVSTDVAPAKVSEKPVAGKVNEEKTFKVILKSGSELLLSNRGMGFKEVLFTQYKDSKNEPIRLGNKTTVYPFELKLSGTSEDLWFSIQKGAGPNEFIGTALMGGAQILRTLKIEENGSIHSKVEITGAASLDGVSLFLADSLAEKKETSMLFPSYDHQKVFVKNSLSSEEVVFTGAKAKSEKTITAASLVSVGNQYFAGAVLDRSPVLSDVSVQGNPAAGEFLAEMSYKLSKSQEKVELDHLYFLGAMEVDKLKEIDPQLAMIIDYGMLSFVAKPMVQFMKWCHGVVGNWGFAIVLLTLFVRLLTLPFNIMSVRSMKAMQKIQPQMTLVREKYKDDPMTMNREVMNLMKENKANPLGGCLPMLLQIPVFFALFKVIGSSVELYQSPFILWIHDLSAHDPFYVLPVAQGATMFIQQKITPTTMEPTQAKVMAFLPLIFTVFMLKIPSGLALYMFVSGLFGLIQQWYIMREKKA